MASRKTLWIALLVLALVATVLGIWLSRSRVAPLEASSVPRDAGSVLASVPVPVLPVAAVDSGSDRQVDAGDPDALPNCGNGVVDEGELCDPNVSWGGRCPGGFGLCWVCSFDCHHKRLWAGPVPQSANSSMGVSPFCSETGKGESAQQTWNGKGQVTSIVNPVFTWLLTWDEAGNLVSDEMRQRGKRPELGTYTCDTNGRMLSASKARLDDAGVSVEYLHLEWDSRGWPLRDLAPGRSDRVSAYDDVNHTYRSRYDKNGDGVYDQERREIFDDAGTKIHVWVDENGDGIPEQDFSYQHNDAGEFQDLNGNGVHDEGEELDPDVVEETPRTSVVFDEDGLVLSQRTEGDPPTCIDYTYDTRGLLKTVDERSDCNGDHSGTRTSWTYDTFGLVTSITAVGEKKLRDTQCLAELAADLPWALFTEIRIGDAERRSGTAGLPEVPQ